MKTTIVPAQITTVEDKIAGNLTLKQMSLLALPVFIDFLIYAALPTTLKLKIYKIIIMALMTIVCGVLATRIRGKILLSWLTTIGKYNRRPSYYIYDKNDSYLRNSEIVVKSDTESTKAVSIEQPSTDTTLSLSFEELMSMRESLANHTQSMSFTTRKKGGLYVTFTQIKE